MISEAGYTELRTVPSRAFALVYRELRALARGRLARFPVRDLDPTELVHGVYLRLEHKDQMDWPDRRNFFGLFARALRDFLVEHARAAQAKKRGGDEVHEPLDSAVVAASEDPGEFLMLDDALSRLSEHDPLSGEIVHLRFIVGLSIEEIAQTLVVSTSTVDRRWKYAKSWLHKDLRD